MKKPVIELLATSLGKRDEEPNIRLAEQIVKKEDNGHVAELMELLQHKKTDVRNDAIKVLYEIGERNSTMISGYLKNFIALLSHKDNRMQLGAMCALSAISKSEPQLLAKHLTTIVEAMDRGTVITRDHGIYILCHISKLRKEHEHAIELLLEQVDKSPVNQLPMYAEKTAEVISFAYVPRLVRILEARSDVAEIPSKAKRVEKVIKQLQLRAK